MDIGDQAGGFQLKQEIGGVRKIISLSKPAVRGRGFTIYTTKNNLFDIAAALSCHFPLQILGQPRLYWDIPGN
ncbi:MAG: hypothetical protein P4N59_07575 [Negativicutes bacterium]|nr:hypothetical protein [Negativicutes bacterium]